METIRHSFKQVQDTLEGILLKHEFSPEKATLSARLFVETSLDGVYSHGLNRFPLFVEYIKREIVIPGNEPLLIREADNFERWDGNQGAGNLNAWFCMDRAIRLAEKKGIGTVALRNTNHWMRGGSYGLQAAGKNCIGICMTNTTPNMPPWGSRKGTIGNNPLIIAVPAEPYPVLLDMAMSQYSYGKMEIMDQLGEELSQYGGFDENFELTRNPGKILDTSLSLPAGYWKGSGLAILMDILVAVLSEGLTTDEIGNFEQETLLSQLFIAFNLDRLTERSTADRIIRTVLNSVTGSQGIEPGQHVFYPGQQTWHRRQENEKLGIPVARETWEKILQL